MRLLCLGSLLLGVCISFADEDLVKAKASAALQLAKAKRDRDKSMAKSNQKAAIHEGEFYDDITLAKAVSKSLNRPLVIWVGIKPTDHRQILKELEDETINVYLSEYNNKTDQRIVVYDPKEKSEIAFLRNTFDSWTPIAIRLRLGLSVDLLYIKYVQQQKQQSSVILSYSHNHSVGCLA